MASPAATSGVLKFLTPRKRPQSTDIQAAAAWGFAAGTTALWLVQVWAHPFSPHPPFVFLPFFLNLFYNLSSDRI